MRKRSIFLISIVSFFTSCQRATPEIFIIPEGYNGKVMVVFEKKNGSKPEYENNKRVYDIPVSGVLVSQFSINDGFISREFFYVDSLGKRTPIRIFRIVEDAKNTNETGIFYSGTAGLLGNSSDSLSVIFQEFIVSDYKSLQSYLTEEYKQQFKKKIQQAVGYPIN